MYKVVSCEVKDVAAGKDRIPVFFNVSCEIATPEKFVATISNILFDTSLTIKKVFNFMYTFANWATRNEFGITVRLQFTATNVV